MSEATPTRGAPEGPRGRLRASPRARKLAADHALPLDGIAGSGPGGRIVRADVEARLAQERVAADAPADRGRAAAQEGRAPREGSRRSEPALERGHVTLRRTVSLDALLTLRHQMNARPAAQGVRLSLTDFLVKACALALQSVPECNTVWSEDGARRLTTSDIAVSVAGGRLAPVLRDAERRTLSDLATERRSLADRARTGRLTPADCTGGTLTLANLGPLGVESVDAALDPPRTAILAVGTASRKPVVSGDTVEIATLLQISLTVDGRMVDPATGAGLLRAIADGLETPVSLLV